MREGHLGRGTDYIGRETRTECWLITHKSAHLLLKIWHKGQYFLWVSKSTSVRMILHQRHSNKDICISTSQGTWQSNIFTSRGVTFTSCSIGGRRKREPCQITFLMVKWLVNGINGCAISHFSIDFVGLYSLKMGMKSSWIMASTVKVLFHLTLHVLFLWIDNERRKRSTCINNIFKNEHLWGINKGKNKAR